MIEEVDAAREARLDKPGRYPFFCRNHPKMTGTITVK